MEVTFIFNIQQWFRTFSRLQLKKNQLGNIFSLVCFKYTGVMFLELLIDTFEDKIKTCLLFMLVVRVRNRDTYSLK